MVHWWSDLPLEPRHSSARASARGRCDSEFPEHVLGSPVSINPDFELWGGRLALLHERAYRRSGRPQTSWAHHCVASSRKGWATGGSATVRTSFIAISSELVLSSRFLLQTKGLGAFPYASSAVVAYWVRMGEGTWSCTERRSAKHETHFQVHWRAAPLTAATVCRERTTLPRVR